MSTGRPWTDNDWWHIHKLSWPSQGMSHLSLTSSLFEGRMVYHDYSRDKPLEDLSEVMRIVLPCFKEMKARNEAVSERRRIGYPSDSSDSSPSVFGPTSIDNITMCLDVAESVAKMVPVFGGILEGACGVLRKIILTTQGARAARDECKALAEHTACITLAIVHKQIAATSTARGSSEFKNLWDLFGTINEVEKKVIELSKLRKVISRGKINAEVLALRAQVDNARTTFQIRNDISVTQLLTDLKMGVSDLREGQRATHDMLHITHYMLDSTHHMLNTVLGEVRGRGTGGTHVEEAY
ncbi:hypothetical protein BDZ89DRAFT_578960 [Hymenopellis radicata]|nr:hypothetical protein BDZ89DRAFT_578960 [Hymenopellis radicata]